MNEVHLLGMIIGLQNDLGKPISKNDAQKLFQDVWAEIELLLEMNYLAYDKKDEEKIVLTPIGKAAMKNISKDLSIRNFIDFDR